MGKRERVDVAERVEALVEAGAVWVEPARVVADAVIGDLVAAKLEDLAEVREEGLAGKAHATALGAAVDEDAGEVDAVKLARDAAEDALVLVEADVVEVLGPSVQACDEVT